MRLVVDTKSTLPRRDDEVAILEDLDVLGLELRLIAVEPHRHRIGAGDDRHALGLALVIARDRLHRRALQFRLDAAADVLRRRGRGRGERRGGHGKRDEE